MTRHRSLETKTRFLTSSIFSFAVLTVLIAFAAPAQQSGTGQPAKSSSASVPAQASSPARARVPLMPGGNNAGRAPASRPPKKKHAARAMGPDTPLFLPVVTYDSGGDESHSVAVADVNGDGKPDLLVANYCVSSNNCAEGSVGVLLGRGDGTFQPAVAYSSGGSTTASLAVADLNGDGKPDLVVASQSGSVGALLGIGDGTFQPVVTYSAGGAVSVSVAVADVNGDGKPDLLVANQCDTGVGNCKNPSVGVLLGTGDGTFQAATTYAALDGLDSLAVADVNGDGKPDLLVTSGSNNNNIGVLLGTATVHSSRWWPTAPVERAPCQWRLRMRTGTGNPTWWWGTLV